MMKKKHIALWIDFREALAKSIHNGSTKAELFKVLVQWLSSHKQAFQKRLWAIYQLDTYVDYDPFLYPLDLSEETVKQIVDRAYRFEPLSSEGIILFIRDALWDMVAYLTNNSCIYCGRYNVRVLFDELNDMPILSCDLCGLSYFESGERWREPHYLIPTTTLNLRRFGYIV